MIKAFLFDLDGVLTLEKTGSQSILRYLAQQTGLAFDVLKQGYTPFNRDLLCGKIVHQDMWPAFCEKVGRVIPFCMLEEAFRHTPMDEEMIALARELKRQYLIGMVTDNKADRVQAILKYFGLTDLFNAISISAQVGSRKDDETTFWHVLNELQIRPEEAVFIDNSPENLIIPERIGMHTVWFNDEQRDIKSLRQTLKQWT